MGGGVRSRRGIGLLSGAKAGWVRGWARGVRSRSAPTPTPLVGCVQASQPGPAFVLQLGGGDWVFDLLSDLVHHLPQLFMWGLPEIGTELLSPKLAGGLVSTGSLGKAVTVYSERPDLGLLWPWA